MMTEEERFLAQMRAIEDPSSAPTLLASLTQHGIEVLPPDDLVGEELERQLWHVINGIALLGVYLEHTDHLSDAELYRSLWETVLCEPTVLFPEDPSYGYHIDFIGTGSEEDIQLYLRYYADDENRRIWQEDQPDPIPPRENPPHDRDRKLPQQDFSVVESGPSS